MPKGEGVYYDKIYKKERKKGSIIYNSHRRNDCLNVYGM